MSFTDAAEAVVKSSIAPHRTENQTTEQVQQGNAEWWTNNPMTYDWRGEVDAHQMSAQWFDELDARFIHGARLFATDRVPFDRIMPLHDIAGKRVLEIGCGVGLHTETLARHGAHVTAIDLTPTAIRSTARRLELKGLHAKLLQMDAERLTFADTSFDFVWSWGVIHHSARTARIVRQIARVLKPDGETRVMVYNREGMSARVALVRDHLLKLRFLDQSYDETLWRFTDGFTARHYVKEQFEDLFRAFFDDVSSTICGQDADVVPLPRALRRMALRLVSEGYLRKRQARTGSFIFLSAKRPA